MVLIRSIIRRDSNVWLGYLAGTELILDTLRTHRRQPNSDPCGMCIIISIAHIYRPTTSNWRVDSWRQCAEQSTRVLFPRDHDQRCHSRVRSRPRGSEHEQKCHVIRHVPHVHLPWCIRGHPCGRLSLFQSSAHAS